MSWRDIKEFVLFTAWVVGFIAVGVFVGIWAARVVAPPVAPVECNCKCSHPVPRPRPGIGDGAFHDATRRHPVDAGRIGALRFDVSKVDFDAYREFKRTHGDDAEPIANTWGDFSGLGR
jgi:hypothetical protein